MSDFVDGFVERSHPLLKQLIAGDREATIEEISTVIADTKKVLITDHIKLFGFMLYLLRKKLKLTQADMGIFLTPIGTSKRKNKGFSKSGYSKIENGELTLDFEIVFFISYRLKCDINVIFSLYYEIIKIAYENNAVFLINCENLGQGKQDLAEFNPTGIQNEYFYTKLTDYKKYFGKDDLERIDECLNKIIGKFVFNKRIYNFLKSVRDRRLNKQR